MRRVCMQCVSSCIILRGTRILSGTHARPKQEDNRTSLNVVTFHLHVWQPLLYRAVYKEMWFITAWETSSVASCHPRRTDTGVGCKNVPRRDARAGYSFRRAQLTGTARSFVSNRDWRLVMILRHDLQQWRSLGGRPFIDKDWLSVNSLEYKYLESWFPIFLGE
jgi:hypothetical protein